MYLFREKKQRNLTTPENIDGIRVFTGDIIAGNLHYGFIRREDQASVCRKVKKPFVLPRQLREKSFLIQNEV